MRRASRLYLLAIAAFAACFCTAVTSTRANAAELGATVSNIATVSYDAGSTTETVTTPPATFMIEARRTPSTIDFFRFSPNAPDGITVQINGSDYAPSVDSGGNPVFQSSGPPITTDGATIDLSSPVTLALAENYFSGELIILRVIDTGQNGDPAAIETVTATIVSDTGDEITLQLYESGPDTGAFFAYVRSSSSTSPINDNILAISSGEQLTATYQDPFDTTEISIDVAGVDPFGHLFDSTNGDLIDGAQVTIVDANTGAPAQVFGVDGISDYPSTLITGGEVTDESGFVYTLEPGQFLFPIMFPGTYRLVIEPPEGFTAPSTATADEISALPASDPFIITDASYLGSFIVDGTGDVTFDVPLDPSAELLVTKETSTQVGAIGDFVRYDIAIENIGESTAQLAVRDLLPEGFRYQRNSARRDGVTIAKPGIAPNGRTLTFNAGLLPAGETAHVTYVTEITSGAQTGDAVNQAFVIDGREEPLSNTGQASVFIREDLLRSKLTIVGRVAADACDPNQDWPREIHDGEGVENVRLYMETGAYVMTDEDGLFHFEDVEARTHVVQLDTESLPDGYEPVFCEENTRYAGSAISQFVDAQGGSAWRANFYLRKTDIAQNAADKKEEQEPNFNDATEYKNYDKAWLNLQDADAAWTYPALGTTPSTRSVNIGVKHDAKQRVELLLNGAKVPAENFAGREVSLTRTVALTRWRSVDLVDGENNFVAIIQDLNKKEILRLERQITFVTEAANATLHPEQSNLIADGKHSPVISVRLTDRVGRPVRAGQLITVTIDPPYRAKDLQRLEDRLPITAPLSAKTAVTTGPDGIAAIELEPTLQTGRARIEVGLSNGRSQEFVVYLKPELRDWIVVGMAEGSTTLEESTSEDIISPSARQLLREGRIAVFMKGTVKGGWLVTAAGDTAKKRGDQDDELFEAIDPDSRYSIYGDRSTQQFEAQSRYPVYLKAEKDAFQAVFGDYDTGLNEARLGKYARRLSGLQTTYEGKTFRFSGFAAETNQDFIRDEIAADGTSGPFRLTTTPMVRNSETLLIESRNRFRPDEVISSTPLTRYFDYDIDFETGELLFRLPIPLASDDESFNVIVAEYESSAPVERNIVAGGRGAVRFAKDRAEAGLTIIHEEGRPGAVDAQSSLAAVDLRVDITDTTKLRFEYGTSRRETEGDDEEGSAFVADIEHVSKNVTARAYYDEIDADFGLNQQSSAGAGMRRYGGEVAVKIDEFHSERTGRRGERYVEAKAYREENLVTGANRSVAEVALRQESDVTSGALGLRSVVENTADDVNRKSLLAVAEARHSFEKLGLTLKAAHDQPISQNDNSILFPKRTTIGFDQKLFDSAVTLSVSHEIQDNDQVHSANTIVGVAAEPWTGARLTASADKITQDSGQRLGATFGVDQQIPINEKWVASFGVSRREELDNDGNISQLDDIVVDRPISPLENNGDFTSMFVGAGYRGDVSTGSARLEMRKSTLGDRYVGVFGAAREVSETLSLAGAARLQKDDNDDNDERPDEHSIDARLGLAWRPRGEGLIAFNRFDIKQHVVDGELNSWKAVNNLAINAMIDERWQVSFNHGFKYSALEADNAGYSGVTQLFGVETRYDITDKIDLGFRGSMLYSHNAKTIDYSYGPSIGVNPADNVWLSLGWNFSGFVDDDFAGAEFTREGPYLQLRIKFDQNTARGLLNSISPSHIGAVAE